MKDSESGKACGREDWSENESEGQREWRGLW